MRKILSAAAVAAALLASTSANAASLLFQFDAANSKIEVANQGSCLGFGCHITPSLELPTGVFSIEEGASQTFDFAKLVLSGVGLATGVQLKATLAFLSPDADPATSNGGAWYGTFFGVVNGGQLTWSSIAPITTADGSKFTVAFEDLSGLDTFTVHDKVKITVNDVAAVPEPGVWALLISGFGMMGAMLRRRRTASLALAA